MKPVLRRKNFRLDTTVGANRQPNAFVALASPSEAHSDGSSQNNKAAEEGSSLRKNGGTQPAQVDLVPENDPSHGSHSKNWFKIVGLFLFSVVYCVGEVTDAHYAVSKAIEGGDISALNRHRWIIFGIVIGILSGIEEALVVSFHMNSNKHTHTHDICDFSCCGKSTAAAYFKSGVNVVRYLFTLVAALLRGTLSYLSVRESLEQLTLWSNAAIFTVACAVGACRCIGSYFVHGTHTPKANTGHGEHHGHGQHGHGHQEEAPCCDHQKPSTMAAEANQPAESRALLVPSPKKQCNQDHPHKHQNENSNEHQIGDSDEDSDHEDHCGRPRSPRTWKLVFMLVWTYIFTSADHGIEYYFATRESTLLFVPKIPFVALVTIIGLVAFMGIQDGLVEAHHVDEYEQILSYGREINFVGNIISLLLVLVGAIGHVIPAYAGWLYLYSDVGLGHRSLIEYIVVAVIVGLDVIPCAILHGTYVQRMIWVFVKPGKFNIADFWDAGKKPNKLPEKGEQGRNCFNSRCCRGDRDQELGHDPSNCKLEGCQSCEQANNARWTSQDGSIVPNRVHPFVRYHDHRKCNPNECEGSVEVPNEIRKEGQTKLFYKSVPDGNSSVGVNGVDTFLNTQRAPQVAPQGAPQGAHHSHDHSHDHGNDHSHGHSHGPGNYNPNYD